ncbi:M28 family peptidase [Namhaeicola litoreus]|uniref:M28 family peptidase n=1 Tax=Namhaeicola litoreus TaxID=1052145 RepID=A0ABW3XX35_9FLAO
MKKIILSSALLLSGIAFAQAPMKVAKSEVAMKYGNSITVDDLKEDLTILASDALEGRETGKRGQKMAAAFIESTFRDLGLQPVVKNGNKMSYFQEVELVATKPGNIYVKIGEETLKNMEDGVVYSGTGQDTPEIPIDIVFGGEGSEAELASLDLENKGLVIVQSDRIKTRSASKYAYEKGAKMIFVVNQSSDEKYDEYLEKYTHYLTNERLGLASEESSSATGNFYIKPSVAEKLTKTSMEKLLKANENFASGKTNAFTKIKGNKVSFKLGVEKREVLSENVLGYLEGTDLKDEVIIITAHYDHVGVNDGKVYNGADDDGSGTVGLLEIAEAFSLAKAEGHGPRRSILFMPVTGEEKGLLGSAYYAEHPVFPFENTMVDLNIDMIGRIGNRNFETEDYVFLVGADKLSQELHDISEEVNSTYTNLHLDYTFNDQDHPERIYYRSDHWNFAKNNIPIIFYYNGSHVDYHKDTDTVDKIEFDLLKKRTELIFYTAWELANKEGKLTMNK